ncbi:50S ribosomal protein L13 [Ignisphaera sp. 4213-co]|uniref:Large ribosomal subunit protein uL13 n=1 Tax=Ignisphaera cupida TaxID=3050454 RepID=A0ABD4Z5H2_9CREN|nr:50S ribosomal protein L13 [Ignisphaera sp. 4213-co]MDK6028552.1 50S ribosomal protein L13 [Ignisphaera sp. 4213-co]
MRVIEVSSKELYTNVLSRNIQELVIDADSMVLGRLASIVAKLALMNIKIHVVNVEKAVLTGDKNRVIEGYKLLFNVKTHKNPYRHAIHRPRNPVTLFKKTVKNMLPKHNWRGVEALKNIKAYIDIPSSFQEKDVVKIVDISIYNREAEKYITLAELAKALGWHQKV